MPSSTLSSSSDSQPFGVTGGKDSDEKEAPPSSTGALDVGSISKETPLTRELISSVTVSSLKTPPSSYNFTSSTRENDEDGHVSLDGQHIDGIEGESPAQPLAPSQSEQPGVSRVCYSANASVRGEQQNSADKLSSTCVSSTVVDGSTRHHDTRSNPTASPAREGVDVEAARPCAPLAHAQIYQHTDASFEEQNSECHIYM